MSEYSALDITRDAVEFAESRFGQHYLSRLEKARTRALDEAEVCALDGNTELEHARLIQAATIRKELAYFETAKTVADNPNLMQRLRDKALRRQRKGGPDMDL